MAQRIGRYEIIEEIGSGGFATVFKALDTVLEREVALKVMRPLLMSDPEFVYRFQREAKTIAKLQHPHIVPIHDYGEIEGRFFLVMQLCPQSVATLLKNGPLSWERATQIIRQAAVGLDFAHEQGLVHRDIKPDNILIDGQGQAVLGDFGLVKALEHSAVSLSMSMSGGILGTPAYIAPEIWNGQSPDPATDIYALGCVLAEMLAGQSLFNAPTPFGIMALHAKPPNYPVAWPPDVPAGIEAMLNRALAKEPQNRYSSAGALAKALDALSQNALAAEFRQLETALENKDWDLAIAAGRAIMAKDSSNQWGQTLLLQALIGKKSELETELQSVRKVKEYRKKAAVALAAHDWEALKTVCQQWLQVSPKDQLALEGLNSAHRGIEQQKVNMYREKAAVVFEHKDWDQLITILHEWLQLTPDDEEAQEALEQAQLNKEIVEAVKNDDVESVVKLAAQFALNIGNWDESFDMWHEFGVDPDEMRTTFTRLANMHDPDNKGGED